MADVFNKAKALIAISIQVMHASGEGGGKKGLAKRCRKYLIFSAEYS